MGKVFFEKKGKVISIPWTIVDFCKIRGLYSYDYRGNMAFDNDVDRVRFYQCNVKNLLKFEQRDHQKMEFVECNFTPGSEISLCGGSLDIYDSFLNDVSITVSKCKNVSLLFNKDDTSLSELSVSSSNTDISGNFKSVYGVKVNSNAIYAHDLKIDSKYDISFSAPYLSMEDCSFEYRSCLYVGYNHLNMNHVEFLSEYGNLHFRNITGGSFVSGFKHDTITTYTYPVVLTDSDILSEKNQEIYSLLSILKGYGLKNHNINDRDIKKITSKIDSDYEIKIGEIEQEQQRLNKQKEKLLQQAELSKKWAEEGLTKRKIKQLTYPKK